MTRNITPFQDLAALFKLIRVLRRIRPDILHISTPKAGLLGSIAGRIVGIRTRYYLIRGFRFETKTGLLRFLLILAERLACSLATDVGCVSESVRQLAIREKIASPGKLHVHLLGSSNGVDAERRFNPELVPISAIERVRSGAKIPKDAFLVGFIGRIVRDKGLLELAEAFLKVLEKAPHAYLLLVGPREPQDPLPKRTIDLLSSHPQIRMIDQDWNAAPILGAIDLLVLPTYREGFPNILIEAAAMERPVVATRVTGCVDAVVERVTGILVRPFDADALADAIVTYATQPNLRREHGMNARKHVLLNYASSPIWESMFRAYTARLS